MSRDITVKESLARKQREFNQRIPRCSASGLLFSLFCHSRLSGILPERILYKTIQECKERFRTSRNDIFDTSSRTPSGCGVVHFDLEIELYSLARVFIRNSCCLHSRLFLFHIFQFFCLILLLLYCEIKVDHQPAMLLDFRVFFHFKVPPVRLQGIIH